jgi:hypothetical protein
VNDCIPPTEAKFPVNQFAIGFSEVISAELGSRTAAVQQLYSLQFKKSLAGTLTACICALQLASAQVFSRMILELD